MVPRGAASGQVLAGKSPMFIDITPCYSQPSWIEGALTLSRLLAMAGDRVSVDLRVNEAEGWESHARAEVEVSAATNR